ncbi:hypothetical protein BpHYR1_002663 [Brachionus plicatilis]|uniref:Uncharacterized protein n=1 Tax=Brachionus plicatilis TaxID=10195 RepID=A0A3M7RMQ8_BRAPC|nr:hypothetical protein BpHYR1_002663 [Brachionus plicatilis]
MADHILGLRAELMQKLANEPRDQKAKHNGVVRLKVHVRRPDVSRLPHLGLPLGQTPHGRLHVEQHHLRIALDQPVAVHNSDALGPHRVYGGSERAYLRLFDLHLGSDLRLVQWTHSYVVVAELQLGRGHLASDHRKNTKQEGLRMPPLFATSQATSISHLFMS